MRYIRDCTVLSGYFINELKDASEEVSYDELIDVVPESTLQEFFPDYDWGNGEGGLKLEDDYAVSFKWSEVNGSEYWFVQWSSIEFIWRVDG